MSIPADPPRDIGDLREARQRRLRVTKALYGADRERALLVPELADLLALVRGNRAAVVWLDGFALDDDVHPYAVLDLGNDRPDRDFSHEPLVDADELGLHGLLDIGGRNPLGGRARSLVAASLGADGVRSWFVLADGGTPRPWLTPMERARVKYIAGRVSAIVLHRDLGPMTTLRGMLPPGERGPSFTGAVLLKDVVDEPHTERADHLAATRFLVARLVGEVVEQDGVFSSHLGTQIAAVRAEVAKENPLPSEASAWEGVLRALETGDLRALGDATLPVARHAEAAGHHWSCAQLSSWAYDLAVASGNPATAAAAADAMATACVHVSNPHASTHWTRVRRQLQLAQGDAPGVEQPLD